MKSYHAKGYYAFPINTAVYDRSYCYWADAFTYEELKQIIALCDAREQVQAKVGGQYEGDQLLDIRACKLAWLEPDAECAWIYDRFAQVVQQLNSKHFGFDIQGFHDGLQYALYDGTIEKVPPHYDWHVDTMGKASVPVRKLTVTMQLSDPMDYEGGELWISGLMRTILPKGMGLIHVFPSYTSHRVTPVTAGVRRTLTAWAVGPEFR